MKTMSKLVMSVAVAAVVVLSGCAGPDMETRKAADYGTFPANYEAIIAGYHEDAMKDPESARVKYLGGPKKALWKAPIARDGTYGYLVCLSVNAKNSYGAYTGTRNTAVFIRDGNVLHYIQASDDISRSMVEKMCTPVIGHFMKEGDE